MFFKNALMFLALKFLWVGLIFGLIWILCSFVIRLSRCNVFVFNIITFMFLLSFGFVFGQLCIYYYNYSFCWFGLLFMAFGVILVKISMLFFFTIFVKLLYNKFITKFLRGKKNGKLQQSEKS